LCIKNRRLRVGVLGLIRGSAFVRMLLYHPDAELSALCDFDPQKMEALKRSGWGDELAKRNVPFYRDFARLLEHDLDAVILANYAPEHVPAAIQALAAGKHVLSEVPACSSVGEAVELVEAVEKSGLVYMIGENVCFYPHALEMRRRYQAGEIGEFQHGEGEYVHDLEPVWVRVTGGNPEHWRNWRPSTFYCTHALGPLLYITGTRVCRVTGMETPNRVGYRHGRRHGDSGVMLCQMSNQATVKILISHGGIKREPPSHWLCVGGTEGSIESSRWNDDKVFFYRRGEAAVTDQSGYLPDPDLIYKEEIDRPEMMELAYRFKSHGAADFLTLNHFIQVALGRRENQLDVYRAVDMSLPGLLAYRSALNGNIPYEVPDLRLKENRDKWRDDFWCTDPKAAHPGQLLPPCSFPVPDIDPEVYRRQEEEAKFK